MLLKNKKYQELVGICIFLILMYILNALITKWFDGQYYNISTKTFLEFTSHYALQECNIFKRNILDSYACRIYAISKTLKFWKFVDLLSGTLTLIPAPYCFHSKCFLKYESNFTVSVKSVCKTVQESNGWVFFSGIDTPIKTRVGDRWGAPRAGVAPQGPGVRSQVDSQGWQDRSGPPRAGQGGSPKPRASDNPMGTRQG